jgi:hypothetical protein
MPLVFSLKKLHKKEAEKNWTSTTLTFQLLYKSWPEQFCATVTLGFLKPNIEGFQENRLLWKNISVIFLLKSSNKGFPED